MFLSQIGNFYYHNYDISTREKIRDDNNNKIKSNTAYNTTYIYKNNFSALLSCTGSGSYSDPYIIKNLEIDGKDSLSCIVIEDSNAFFRIENCTLYNIGSLSSESAGIKLINTSNGMLVNNSCSSNWDGNFGIYLYNDCQNNTITNNTIRNTQNGIYLNDICHNNTITDNLITDVQNGIYLYKGCHNNTVTDNIVSLSTFSGIHLNDACNDNLFSRNILNDNDLMGMTISSSNGNNITDSNEFSNNRNGLYLLLSSNNIISDNNEFSSNEKYGIYLSTSSMNIFKGNTISDNKDIGLYVFKAAGSSNYNQFYENFFMRNKIHAVDEGVSNNWNNSNIGNYWDNYSEIGVEAIDSDDDGIGDISYNFTGGTDYFPIWSDGIEEGFIEIDDLASGYNAHNWTWASGRFWCSGSGIASDPYMIKPNILWDGKINGNWIHNGISISNSTKYFKIENCAFYYSAFTGAGIILYNTTNGEIINNKFNNNYGNGMSFYNSSQNRIIGNIINYNWNIGIYLDANSSNNEIVGDNALNYNKIGLYMKKDCNSNNVSSNFFTGNAEYGLHLANSSCKNNIIYNNTFQANTLFNSLDNETSNKWYYGELGNIWDDYPGADADDDGIGDNPYIIGNVFDKFPIFDDGLDGKPLYIDALATGVGAHNWTWASKRLYISGSGTFENPYAIKDIFINGQDLESCIVIENSKVHFIIENCTLYNSSIGSLPNYDAGIKLVNTTNGLIIYNNCSSNNQCGIYLYLNCENNTISENWINNNTFGIYLNNCKKNIISGNFITNNSNDGIYLYISNENNFTDNILKDNANRGIFVDGTDGGCNNNRFYYNNFTGNIIHAIDIPSSNYWNSTDIGNFWSNYTDVDADDDGIGDSPYLFNGGIDWLPIWDDGNNGSKIHIDGKGINAPNWEWAITRSWCSGSGSFSDPYIVKNVEINGENAGTCIIIENSSVFFRIENCKVYNSGSDTYDAGIKLSNVSNGVLINNNCSNNNHNGVLLYDGCSNNTISENTCNNNGVNGIKLEISCENNTLFKNSYCKNEIGIYLNQCHNTEISHNSIKNNDLGIGIDYNSDSNKITNNILKNNTDYGVAILQYFCEYNIFFNNTFIENKINAKNDGINNNWDNGIIGNYWDDYIGKDPDDDGISSTPYSNIIGIIGGIDNYPIWWDGPVINIMKPLLNEEFEDTPPTYHIRVDEGKGNCFWYEIMETGITSSVTKLSGNLNLNIWGTVEKSMWDNIMYGHVSIKFYVNDSKGCIGYKEVEIIKNIPIDDDEDDWEIREGIPPWLQVVYIGVINACASLILILFYNENIKRKKLYKEILDKFERVENIMAFLRENLDKNSWIKLKKPLDNFQKRRITSKDFIKKCRKILGDKFVNLFTESIKEQ